MLPCRTLLLPANACCWRRVLRSVQRHSSVHFCAVVVVLRAVSVSSRVLIVALLQSKANPLLWVGKPRLQTAFEMLRVSNDTEANLHR